MGKRKEEVIKSGEFIYVKEMCKGEFEILIRDIYKDHCDPRYFETKSFLRIWNFDGWQLWKNGENENKCSDIYCQFPNCKSKWERHGLLTAYGFRKYNP